MRSMNKAIEEGATIRGRQLMASLTVFNADPTQSEERLKPEGIALHEEAAKEAMRDELVGSS